MHGDTLLSVGRSSVVLDLGVVLLHRRDRGNTEVYRV